MIAYNYKDEGLRKYIILLFWLTFIFSGQIREGLLKEDLGGINYLGFVVIVVMFIKYNKYFNKKYIAFLTIMNIYLIGSMFFYQSGMRNIIFSYICFIVPLFLIGLEMEKESFHYIYKYLLFMLNVIIILITIFGIMDLALDNKIIDIFSKIMSPRIKELILLQPEAEFRRMFSFMGHPLFNTQLYIMFYVLNMIYDKYYKALLPKALVIILSMIGISLTVSKTGLIILIVMLIFFNKEKINITYYICIITILILAIKFGIFEDSINRLTTGSLTTGRSEIGEIVEQYNIFPLKFFTGYGLGFTFQYNQYISWASAAFEYPIKLFALEQGIFNAMIIYFCIAVYPIYKFIIRKHFFLLTGFLFVFIDINTYNGLAIRGDYMLIFCMFIFILLNISNLNTKDYFVEEVYE